MGRVRSQPTPNPNSLKFTRDGAPFISGGLESFSTAEEAGGHALGGPLMALDGVVNVLILPQFVTVSKAPEARWDSVLPEITSILEG